MTADYVGGQFRSMLTERKHTENTMRTLGASGVQIAAFHEATLDLERIAARWATA
jgi:hypothetical protein